MNAPTNGSKQPKASEDRDWPGAIPRLVPLGVVALLFAARLAAWPTPWGSVIDYAGWGFGLIALVAALHVLALLLPGRYAVEGAAWTATVILAFIMLLLFAPAGGH